MKNLASINAIALSLKYWRKKSSLTQADVSVDLECGIKKYQSYEESRALPSIETLRKLVSLYELNSIDQLIDSCSPASSSTNKH